MNGTHKYFFEKKEKKQSQVHLVTTQYLSYKFAIPISGLDDLSRCPAAFTD